MKKNCGENQRQISIVRPLYASWFLCKKLMNHQKSQKWILNKAQSTASKTSNSMLAQAKPSSLSSSQATKRMLPPKPHFSMWMPIMAIMSQLQEDSDIHSFLILTIPWFMIMDPSDYFEPSHQRSLSETRKWTSSHKEWKHSKTGWPNFAATRKHAKIRKFWLSSTSKLNKNNYFALIRFHFSSCIFRKKKYWYLKFFLFSIFRIENIFREKYKTCSILIVLHQR